MPEAHAIVIGTREVSGILFLLVLFFALSGLERCRR
jgi:hypothetical protein